MAPPVTSSNGTSAGSSIKNEKPVLSNSTVSKSSSESSVLPYTPIEEIEGNVKRLEESFHRDQKTHSVQFRLNQLRNIYFALKDNVDDICEALYKDFRRSPSETRMFEYAPLMSEIVHLMACLHKWSRPEKVTDKSIAFSTTPIYVERIPYGVVLVISPFNYPLLLSIGSIVGALSGGNAVVFKPSESTPHFSKLLTEILTKALDPDIFYTVNGAIPETTALLEQKYDKIIYTGNSTVGRIIAKKAAENLTPVILELGGKSPAFVLEDVEDKDIPTIAKRLVWGRFMNAGQTCVAVDYILVHESIKEKLVKAIVDVVEKEFYPSLDEKSKNITHIIHERAFNNLVKIVKESKGDVLTGGKFDSESNYISPTVIDNVDWTDSTMKQELFGPILPIMTYSNLDAELSKLVRNADTPLAQYIFTSGSTSRSKNKELNKILQSVRSGAVVVNDVVLHVVLVNAPFGGIGESGTGSYHGYYSYRSFTHERTTIEQNFWSEAAMTSRYPPYSNGKTSLMSASMALYNDNVWFGRTGNVKVNGPGAIFGFWHGICGVFSLGYKFVNASK